MDLLELLIIFLAIHLPLMVDLEELVVVVLLPVVIQLVLVDLAVVKVLREELMMVMDGLI